MKYYLFPLKFLTPVHFGNAAGGGKLEKIELSYGADALFSAIITEAVNLGLDYERILQATEEKTLLLSSLYPYFDNPLSKELELYLPKPFLRGKSKVEQSKNYEEVKEEATKLKALKKSGFLKASRYAKCLNEIHKGIAQNTADATPAFAESGIAARVNMREEKPLPYYVGSHIFAKHAGMYFILGLEKAELLEDLKKIMESLGYEGIGGKRSSGYGKFELLKAPKELSTLAKTDGKALTSLLEENAADLYVALAPVCPLEGQEPIFKDSFYKLKPCSGFADLGTEGNSMKRDSFFMLAEGSCFKEKLRGRLVKLDVKGLSHAIYRNGNGLFLGVKYHD